MAQTDVKQTTETPKTEEPEYYYEPEYTTWMEDEKTFKIEVELPGVRKENIKIKAIRDSFELTATRGAIGYELNLEFGFEFDPAKVHSHYEEGLLTITFTMVDPMDSAVDVKIE
jgi:HSP20 family protein